MLMDYVNNTLFSRCQISAVYVFIIICVQFAMNLVIIANGKSLKIIYFKVGIVFITLVAYIFMLAQIMNGSIGSEVFLFSSMIMGAASNSFFEVECKKSNSSIKYMLCIVLAFLAILIFVYSNYGWEVVKCVSFLIALLVGSTMRMLKEIYMECVK